MDDVLITSEADLGEPTVVLEKPDEEPKDLPNKTIKFSQIDPIRPYKQPVRGSAYAAGYDICASQDMVVYGTVMVPTNVRIHMPVDMYAKLHPRSGLALKGVTIHQGVIDADYHKEVMVIMMFTGDSGLGYDVKQGDRIAQVIFQQYELAEEEEVTTVRTGGFGSTGR